MNGSGTCYIIAGYSLTGHGIDDIVDRKDSLTGAGLRGMLVGKCTEVIKECFKFSWTMAIRG